MGNNNSYLEPDHTGRERFFITTEDIDRIDVVNLIFSDSLFLKERSY
jgi:hypothetical protein